MLKFKNKCILIIFAVLIVLFGNNYTFAKGGSLLDSSYDEAGYQGLTEYDFAVKAKSSSKWFGLDPNKLIGNYVYLNYSEGATTVYQPHAFCIGHGNTINTAKGSGTYKIETIWDVDVDPNTLPGTSKAYLVDSANKTVYVSKGTDTEKKAARILSKAARFANVVQNQTTWMPYYSSSGSSNMVNWLRHYRANLEKAEVFGTKIGINNGSTDYDASNFGEKENGKLYNQASRVTGYKFADETKDVAKIEQATNNGKTYSYVGPFNIDCSYVKDWDTITGAKAKGCTILGWSKTKGGNISNNYNSLASYASGSNKNKFYIVIKEKIAAEKTVNITLNKSFKTYRARFIFFRNGVSAEGSGAQNILIFRSEEYTKKYSLTLKGKSDEEIKGNLKIVKYDATTSEVMPGVKFYVKQESTGNYLYGSGKELEYGSKPSTPYKTNDNGEISIKGVKPGWYIFEEQTPEGYEENDEDTRVYVNATATLENLYECNLHYALKTLFDNDKIDSPTMNKVYKIVFGSEVKLTDDESSAIKKFKKENKFDTKTDKEKAIIYLKYIFQNWMSSSSKKIKISSRSYTLEEISGNTDITKEYLKDVYERFFDKEMIKPVQQVYYARSQGISSAVIKNKQLGRLWIIKTDKSDTTKALTGAKFKVKNEEGDYIKAKKVTGKDYYEISNEKGATDTFTTSEKETAIKIRGLETGKYTVEETTAPAGYDKSDNTYSTIVYGYNRYKPEDMRYKYLEYSLKLLFNNDSNYTKDKTKELVEAIFNGEVSNENKIVEDIQKYSKSSDGTYSSSLAVEYIFKEMRDDYFNNIKLSSYDTVASRDPKSETTTSTDIKQYLANVYNKYFMANKDTNDQYIRLLTVKAQGNAGVLIKNTKLENPKGNLKIIKTDKYEPNKPLKAEFIVRKITEDGKDGKFVNWSNEKNR